MVATTVRRESVGLRWDALADWLGPTLVFVVALGARFWGLAYGLPYGFYPDEGDKVIEPVRAIAATGDLRPTHFLYPAFWLYVLALAMKLGSLTSNGAASPLEDPIYTFGIARVVTAAVGALSVVLLYLLARRLLTTLRAPGASAYALAGAGFLALSPLHVQHSHVASPDVPTTAFLIAAAYFALRIVEDGRTRWYVLAALATGLASGVKYPSALFAVVIVAAHVARSITATRRPLELARLVLLDRRLWLAGLVTVGIFLATSPYIVLDWARFRADFDAQARRVLSRGPVGELGFTGPLAPVLYLPAALHWGVDTPVAILAVLGLGWSVRAGLRRVRARDGERGPVFGPQLVVLLAFPLALYVFSWTWQDRFARYLVPLVPFACTLAALGLAWLAGRARQRLGERRAAVLAATLALGALLWQADGVIRYDLLLTRRDTRLIAADWMTANLPPGEPALTEWYGPPYPHVRQMGLNLSDRPLERYRERGPRYVATSSFVYNRWLRSPERYPRRVAFYDSLDQEAKLLFAVAPRPDFGYDPVQEGWDGWHAIPLDADARPGPHIRVYQIAP